MPQNSKSIPRLNEYILQPNALDIQVSITAKQPLGSPMTRSNTSPRVIIAINNNPSTNIILSTGRRASILRQPINNIAAHIDVFTPVRRRPTRHSSTRLRKGGQVDRRCCLVIIPTQLIKNTTHSTARMITDMDMNLFLGAGGDTVYRKCSRTPDTPVVECILTKPKSAVHVSSGTQLQNARYQIRRSDQVSTAKDYPRRGLVGLRRANAN